MLIARALLTAARCLLVAVCCCALLMVAVCCLLTHLWSLFGAGRCSSFVVCYVLLLFAKIAVWGLLLSLRETCCRCCLLFGLNRGFLFVVV